MTVQYTDDIKNARLDLVESTVGASAVLKIRSGAKPALITDADAGTVLATLTLPSDWMNPASGGTKTKSGTWEDLVADATGVGAHWRIYTSGGSVQKVQGTLTVTGGGGDMQVANTTITAGQPVSVTVFTLTHGN